jgi:hypothetical protein
LQIYNAKLPDETKQYCARCISVFLRLSVVFHRGNHAVIDLGAFSEILKTYGVEREFAITFHAGLVRNIYFFVAGDEYTELFRIRRDFQGDAG